MKDITKEDWLKYDWINIFLKGELPIFIRGVEETQPPDDGFHYIDVTRFGDKKQEWVRAQEVD